MHHACNPQVGMRSPNILLKAVIQLHNVIQQLKWDSAEIVTLNTMSM